MSSIFGCLLKSVIMSFASIYVTEIQYSKWIMFPIIIISTDKISC